MNIYGENAEYLRNVIFTMASMSAEDLRGMVINRTLYFIVNWGILYEIELPESFVDITCCFWRNNDDLGSFANDICIMDRFDLYNDITKKLDVLSYTLRDPIYINENCLEDAQFQELDKYRPNDGSMKYFIDSSLPNRSFTMINKSFFKLHKGDKLSVYVHDADYNRLLFNYKLYKKKFNKLINIYTLSLNLQ